MSNDILGYVIQGLFVGLGVGFANYLHDRHVRKKLNYFEKQIKKLFKNGEKEKERKNVGKKKLRKEK